MSGTGTKKSVKNGWRRPFGEQWARWHRSVRRRYHVAGSCCGSRPSERNPTRSVTIHWSRTKIAARLVDRVEHGNRS